MERRTIERLFLEEYGYIGNQDELDWFISKYGGDPYQSYEQYRSSVNTDRYCPTDSVASDVSDVKNEFSALFKEIVGRAKAESSNELLSEFGFMTLLFLLKASLFFVLRFGQQKGYCCNL